ncbi:nucleoside deaminase [Lichenihabitans sp. PAMC28606]|uniref:nucleoside deaminase n=1 Tax=Lichenihabitans sp. PAMC28606 TaxID=2880932 RepID=UPI001D0B650D|nr:nucleoside deaminase [Lichenihabitans sp. PAMC28606]UDL94882.1 nucleoside deaminase [Lichenihabitans sp. PAMC28606]
MMASDHDFLLQAVALSKSNMEQGRGGPFGAVIVRDGVVIGEGWNAVTSSNDPTAHAEIIAIRRACEAVGSFSLDGATIFSSCEPCPMCLSAIYWARMGRLVYANTRHEAAAIGFDDAFLYDEVPKDAADRSLPTEQVVSPEARAVFDAWAAKSDKVEY